MESVGLAVGVIGLAGLFSTCLDALQRVDAYKDFGRESRALAAQFEAEKLRLRQWGLTVGIDGNGVLEPHHPALDDNEMRARIVELLTIILEISGGSSEAEARNLFAADARRALDRLYFTSQAQSIRNLDSGSKRQKVAWALGGGVKRAARVQQFALLVQLLHRLIPLDRSKEISVTPGASTTSECELFLIIAVADRVHQTTR